MTQPANVMPHPFDIHASGAGIPDDLVVTWGTIPPASTGYFYLPDVQSTDVITLANTLYPAHRLTAADAHTVACPAAGMTLLPIPQGTGNYAGLLYVDLATVKPGGVYTVAVRQYTQASATSTPPPPPPQAQTSRPQAKKTPPQAKKAPHLVLPKGTAATDFASADTYTWRQLSGAFQYTITIKTKQQALYPEERLLAWLKWRIQVTPSQSRWHPVLLRYLQLIEGRVAAWGGQPSKIPPSQTGDVPGHEPHPVRHKRHEFTGKVIGIYYDRFGDFEGFTILTREGHERWFRGREEEVEDIVYRAWADRSLISVFVEAHDDDWPTSIVLRRER